MARPFTRENAKEMSAKANAVRWGLANRVRETIKSDEKNIELEHYQKRLARVQGQLDMVDKLIVDECSKQQPDPSKLDRLASAQMRLAEQERVLAGRALPGSLKPRQDSPKRTREPLAPMPAQVAQSAPIVPQAPPAVAESTPPVVVSAPPANLANDTRPQGVDF